jgi:hypothetical protein
MTSRIAVLWYWYVGTFRLFALNVSRLVVVLRFQVLQLFPSIHSHSLPIRLSLTSSRKLLHHSLHPIQHIVPAHMP